MLTRRPSREGGSVDRLAGMLMRALAGTLIVAQLAWFGNGSTATASEVTRIVVMPVEYEVARFKPGRVAEFKPEWTESARFYLAEALRGWMDRTGRFLAVDYPGLSTAQQKSVVEQTQILYLVASTAIGMKHFESPAVERRMGEWDFSIGPGLSFLGEASGADKAIFVVGSQMQSSHGVLAAGPLWTGISGALPAIGSADLAAVIVDLRTGAIDWINYVEDVGGTLKKKSHSEKAIKRLMNDYPKGEIFGDS